MINEINDLASEIESIYNGLSDADVNTLREFGQMITFRDGEVIIRKGEHDDAVYILETGKVQAVIDTGLFSKRLHLNIFEGSVFGEMAFIDRRPRTATVLSKGNTTVLKLSRSNIDRIYSSYPQIAQHLVMSFGRVLSERRR